MHFVTLIYFLKVKDLNRDHLTVTINHSGATCASKDSNLDLSKVVNALSCLKCKGLPSIYCRFASTCTAPVIELLLFIGLLWNGIVFVGGNLFANVVILCLIDLLVHGPRVRMFLFLNWDNLIGWIFTRTMYSMWYFYRFMPLEISIKNENVKNSRFLYKFRYSTS